jgi:hypothetical protein
MTPREELRNFILEGVLKLPKKMFKDVIKVAKTGNPMAAYGKHKELSKTIGDILKNQKVSKGAAKKLANLQSKSKGAVSRLWRPPTN